MRLVDAIVFFENGNYASFRDDQQIQQEDGSAFLDVLQDMLDRGVVDPQTRVKMAGWYQPERENGEWTVGELIRMGHLHGQ
jgi:hypothetical protein